MKVSSQFDGGNIEIVDITRPDDVHLRIRLDSNSEFLQWFSFRVSEARDVALTLHLDNAGETSYPPGWHGYHAVATYDRQHFFRVPTRYDGERLTIAHTPTRDVVYYSYFAPYSHERHQDLIARSLAAPGVRHELLGRKVCWITARQHPGETMAEWLMEGLLARLIDPEDPIARALRARAVFYVVPNMNPDGGFRGNLRVNAAGANLNREWLAPSLERSPEVLFVRRRMEATGVDFCLDVHGDEALPYNFIAVRSVTPRTWALQDAYEKALMRASPDFQMTHGYDAVAPGEANMTMCTTFIADHFGCLAMTLEMPFKDTADTPNPELGWSPERCRQLGRANLDALYAVVDELR